MSSDLDRLRELAGYVNQLNESDTSRKDIRDIKDSLANITEANNKDEEDETADEEQVNEWGNTPGNDYADRGMYQEQPEGETVDLSLRRYLDADPMKVKVEEDIDPEAMLREYTEFRGKDND